MERADGSRQARAGSLQLPACNVQAVLPGGGAHTRYQALAGRCGRPACGACRDPASILLGVLNPVPSRGFRAARVGFVS